MNKNELKKVLKPLIKECIKEVVFEDGVLSTIISEVMKGTSSKPMVVENKRPQIKQDNSKRKRMAENRKKMLDAIGKDAFNGVNIFEGTSPASAPRTPDSTSAPGALSGVDPSDSGVDISSFMGDSHFWKKAVGK